MSYTRTAIAAATLLISLSAALPGTQPAAAWGGLAGTLDHRANSHRSALQVPGIEQTTEAPTTITTDTDEQYETAIWALDQMAAAGLELPAIDIYVHTDRIDCSSDPDRLLSGYHTEIDGRHIVHSCGSRWTLVHELAHVWDDHQLDDHDRARIMDHQGLTDWHADSWAASGAEHIASIIAWAIDGAHPTMIGYYSTDHLTDAYMLATGMPLPGTNNDPATPAKATPTYTTATLPEAGMA